MKKFLSTLLCGTMLALTMGTAAFAAEDDLLISPAPSADAASTEAIDTLESALDSDIVIDYTDIWNSVLPERQGDFYVMVNGEFVTFPDAVPQAKDNRSFLPFAAVFSQLGFAEEDMTWNTEGLITASKDDLTIALTLGKNEIVLTKAGESTTIPTDVAPYVDPATWRTYVPFGLVAEALGYNAGWDSFTGTVIIDDVDAIMAAKGETYELMDKYLDYARSFNQKTQKVNGNYGLDLNASATVEDQKQDISFVLDGDYHMIMSGSTAVQFETDMTMDMEFTVDGVDMMDQALAEAGGTFTLPLDLDFDVRYDLERGVFYFKSKALCELLEQPDMANAWFKLDLAALVNSTDPSGTAYETLIQESLKLAESEEMTFEEYLVYLLKTTEPTSIYSTTSDVLDELNPLFADSAFKKSGSKYINTLDEFDLPMSLILYTNGSKMAGFGIEMYMEDPYIGIMELNYTMKNSELDLRMFLDMSETMAEDEVLTMEMTLDGIYRATNTTPATEPPADAVIIDLMALMGGYQDFDVVTVPIPAP